MADIIIKVTADTVTAVTSLEQVKKGLNGVKDGAKGVTAALTPMDAEFKKLSFALAYNEKHFPNNTVRINELKDKLRQLAPAIAATTAAQEANNVATKAATEASGGFAKGLTKAYSGLRTLANIIPGIGIGGLVAIIAGPLIDAFSDLFGATSKATEEQKKFAASLDEVRSKGISTGLELQGFVNIAKDQTQSLQTRNEALLQANKIMGDHGEKLTLLNIATKAVTDEINKFTEATIQQALASKFSDRAADLVIKQMEASKAFGEQLTKTNQAEKDFADFQKRAVHSQDLQEATLGQVIELGRLQDKLIATAGSYRGVTKELGEMKAALANAQTQAAKLFGELGHKGGDETTTKIKELKLKPFRLIIVKPDDPSKIFFDEETIKMKVPVEAELTFKKGLIGTSGNEGLAGILGPEELEAAMDKAKLAGLGITKGLQDGLMVGVEGLRFPELKALTDSAVEQIKAMTDVLKSTLGDLVDTIGENLGKAIASGTGVLSGVLTGVLNVLGEFLIKLGKAAITTSALYVAIKAASKNPITGFIAGALAIVVGNILKNVQLPAFAEGVTNFGGGLAVVGEKGPEVVRLPRGSDVIPNNKLSGIGSMQPIIIISDNTIRGQDIVTSYRRASGTLSRNS